MKICLIGYGYWGNILHKNLKNLGYSDVEIVDIKFNNMELITENFEFYFISTPFKTHYDILTKLSEFKNKKIWCEKPLVSSLDETIEIYDKLEKNNNKLFVDWIYTFNPCIFRLKEIIKEKKLKQVILNRTNNGPVRFDCDSVHDLSTHDLSIIKFLFPEHNMKFKFNEYSVTEKEEFGSCINWSYNDGLQIIINSSWQHENKNRISLFVTDIDEIIVFDDVKKIIINNGVVEDYSNQVSPIQSAMDFFFNSKEFSQNKKLTFDIVKSLESVYEY